MNKIVEQLRSEMKAADDQFIESYVETSIAGIRAAREYINNNPRGQRIDYTKVFELAGGKTKWMRLDGRGLQNMKEILVKDAEATLESRYYRIAARLAKVGIKEVVGSETLWNRDGFQGIWDLETDKGSKKCVVEVIFVGGYNIKCLHTRVLVKIK